MSDINRVNLTGRLTRDSEMKYTTAGTPVLNFSLAVGKSIPPRDGGEWGTETSYFDITVWGKLAEAKSKHLTKGRQVAVEGELKQDRWEQDHQVRSRVKITASQILILAAPRDQGGNGAPDYGSMGAETAAADNNNQFNDDGIPF